MTNSELRGRRTGGKRERLAAAAATVLHEQGIEKTTLADIARAADVPVGNVHYYFKTKNELVEAAIETHTRSLSELIRALDELSTPGERLKALIAGWVAQHDLAVRFGCPTGTLASELDKRGDGLDATVAALMRALVEVDTQLGIGRVDLTNHPADSAERAFGEEDHIAGYVIGKPHAVTIIAVTR